MLKRPIPGRGEPLMTARMIKSSLIALGLGLLTLVVGGTAYACCGAPTPPCCSAPPTCCTPPSPPTPPVTPCCHNVNVPGVNVNVGANVVVNANATAFAVAGARGGSSSVFFGGGGSSWSQGEGASGLIQGLNVEGPSRASYQASRTKIRIVVIQAVCIDDREIPHPASQVTPEREIAETYEGELYRCIAGSHMQITVADYDGKIDFDKGQTIRCGKGEALNRLAGGEIACRPQRPARDCNERSLLRRYGAGVKILKIITTETYTAYREESVSSASTFAMSIDGGVGGIVH